MRIVLLLAVSLMSVAGVFAADVKDSLLSDAYEHTKHGRFEKCKEILEEALDDLSKRDRKAAYNILAVNADLGGQYDELLKCATLLGKKSKYATVLSSQPKQMLSRPLEDVRVGFILDSLYYEGEFRGCMIRVPAVIDGKEEMMIIDNGCAKFSFASESFAKSHGIEPIGIGGTASGVVDTSTMWIGLCDSIAIDRLVFENILFVVVPDRNMVNPVTDIDVIFGSNMFRLAGEMIFDNNDRTILFPAKQGDMESNLSYEADGIQYLDVELGGDTLRFQLDLGSTVNTLNARYYNEHTEKVTSAGVRSSRTKGGLGGMSKAEGFKLQDLVFTACGGSHLQKETFVYIARDAFSRNNYGSIGASFLLSFDKAIFNLAKMYLYVSSEKLDINR